MAQAAAPRVLLVLGDSLSAGYGLPANTGWVKLLQDRLVEQKLPWRVVNASISGDTTAGALGRLPALLAREHPGIVVVELGANDGLRGTDLAQMQQNLHAIIAASRAAHARVMLVGMRLPPNYGSAYVGRFEAIYHDIAKADKVPLTPFLFEGFAERMELFQADGLHPVVAAQPLLLDNIWPQLQPLLAARK